MVAGAAERLVWAVETMAVDPADRVLEIGCGHGWPSPWSASLLAPGGKLSLFHQEPGWSGGRQREFADRLTRILEEHAYSVSDVVIGPNQPTVGVIAQLSSRR